jgi:23S rRNA U2552 (ribose-2'-O)-methylase RlmE/FtsJ
MKLILKSEEVETLINEELKIKLINTKNQIDQYYNIKIKINNNFTTSKWEYYRSLLNKYETAADRFKNAKHRGDTENIKISRAYFKLKEIMIDNKKTMDKIKSAATLAEGPGGFIELLTEFKDNIPIYGITLKYEDDNRNMKKFLSENQNVKIIYGDPNNPSHDGNLYNADVINEFSRQVGKVDLVTADGGFEAKNENNKEVEHLKLFLAETLTAFKILNKGGSFILKIYDIFTRPTLELLYLLSKTFKNVELVKPVSSRPANSERYVVCKGFLGFNTAVHVDNRDIYSHILEMDNNEKEKFDTFVYNLQTENNKYVRNLITNITDVINFIQNNERNDVEKNNKKKEQDIYKEVWEKVYEKRDRKKAKK